MNQNIKMFKKKFQDSRGFTLIEMIIAIAIIGILAGVIIVVATGSQRKANTAKTLSVISSLRPVIALCCSKEGNTLLGGVDPVGNVCSDGGAGVFPTAAEFGATSVGVTVSGCNTGNPALGIKLVGHVNAECNSVDTADVVNYFRVTTSGVEKRNSVANCK